MAAVIGRYRDAMHPATGEIYRRRKDFDDSVNQLNSQLAGFLDAENAKMRPVFAHCFEKHRTDGTDYLIYVGRSLMERGRFSNLYLKDIRLWQIRLAGAPGDRPSDLDPEHARGHPFPL